MPAPHGLRVSRSNYKKKPTNLQNKIMRFVLGFPPGSHIGIEEFTLLHWILVCQRVKLIKLKNICRIVHGNAPQYLIGEFSWLIINILFSSDIVFYRLFYPG